LSLFLALAPCKPAAAQVSPSQPVTFVVGFAAGGAADIVGRLVADKLGPQLGNVTVAVENRPGASGNIAARRVAGAAADGRTILVTTTAIALNETLSGDKGYSALDLRPLAIAAVTPDVLVVNPSNPARALPDLINNAKGKGVTFGTAGATTTQYVSTAYFFKALAKVDATHVPFQGGAPALNALMGNHIDAVAITLPTPVPLILSGQLRGLAVASPARMSVVPDVPTYQEAGYPGFVRYTWVGFFVPRTTSDDIAGALNEAINAVLKDGEFQQKLTQIGFEPNPAPLAAADAQFKSEIETWGKMVSSLGLTAN